MYVVLEGVMNSIHLLLLHSKISLRHFLERPHQRLVLPCSHTAANQNRLSGRRNATGGQGESFHPIQIMRGLETCPAIRFAAWQAQSI